MIIFVVVDRADRSALYLFFGRTLHGKALRATAVNRLGARLMGISTVERRPADLRAGGLHRRALGPADRADHHVFYDSGFLIGLKGFVGAIFGGLASYPAAALGALLVGLLESVRLVLGQRVQGSDRVHADHSGAAVALASSTATTTRRNEAARTLPSLLARRRCVLLAAAAAAGARVLDHAGNYIGLYSSSRSGWCC